MKATQILMPTLKEAPSEAQISSHILLLRAGMIRKEVAGVYNYMPLGLRVINKIEKVIREEMDDAGATEILCSALQPKELWEESGRWGKYGPELMRFNDRHDREFCLGPTHEEIFTDLVRSTIKSAKNLPINIYQIQTKYRDELRPRFGLIRSREFIMKDAYTFDKDEAGLEVSYQTMYDTYSKIYDRLGLRYKAVLADTGAIGGNGSHQFMALSEIGESNILYCDDCGYAADQEKADAICTLKDDSEMLALEEVNTPRVHTIDELTNFLGVTADKTIKAVLYKDLANNKVVCVFVRGDREVNEIKLVNELNIAEAYLTFANDEDIANLGTYYGFIGPVGLNCEILVDNEVAEMKNAVCGGNKKDYHLKNVNFGRDFTGKVLDLRQAVEGDLCPVCGKPMKIERGIEVGQIFKLQTKYSKAMNCCYVDENGQNVPMVMGCYGIGVTRTMSAIIEQSHDDNGIIWPLICAPYHVVVVPVKYTDEAMKELADKIYAGFGKKAETVLDDRNLGFGVKVKDWDLVGIPYQIIVGKRASEGIVEFKDRKTNTKTEMPYEEAMKIVLDAVSNLN